MIGWGLAIGLIFSLLGAGPLGAQEAVPEGAEAAARDASPSLGLSESPEGVPDASPKQHLIEQIEEAQQQLLRAREDLARLQRQQARTGQELEKQQKDKIITEDDLKQGKKLIDDKTREYTDKIDELIKQKADEIMLD